MIDIENEQLFIESVKHGLNLFLGAGFSVLAKDKEARTLPVGNALAEELIQKFSLPSGLKDLPKISTILEATKKQEFIEYLKQRYFVNDFSIKYDIIKELNISSIFTTNIDNLIHSIFEASHFKYLNDIIVFGPTYQDKIAVDYIPVHGCILNEERKLIFNTVDIASSFINEQNVWQFLRTKVTQSPTLFWGYSLEDSGVIQALFSNIDKNKTQQPKWISLRKNHEAEIAYFKSFGFNIIIGDTEGILDWFADNISSFTKSGPEKLVNDSKVVFAKESVPLNNNKLPVRPIRDFYLGDIPFWSDIYSNRIPKFSHYEKVINAIFQSDNLILIGIPASGKTTLMMQIAASIKFDGHKLICTNINLEKAKLINSHLMDDSAIIFIDNFTDIMDVFDLFANNKKVKLVAIDRQHNFETISHRIDRNSTKIYDCTPLTTQDIQELYNHIPQEIRKDRLRGSLNEDIPPSTFEFINLNINRPKINERYIHVIQQLDKSNPVALDLLIMFCYVSSCRTPVSFDMAYSFLSDSISSPGEVYEIIGELGELIQEYKGNLSSDDQDYFVPRSSIISEAILKQVPDEIFQNVFDTFHNNVPKFSICRFDIFKKRAYDADFVKKAYPNWEDGVEFYEYIKNTDYSPFILQQCALYLASKKKYNKAFEWIDEALSGTKKHYFSIKNSHAIILFEANINIENTTAVRHYLDESMEILIDCYNEDKRKTYHSLRFANQSLQYYAVFGDKKALDYIRQAQSWLVDDLRSNPWNRDLKYILRKLQPLI